MRHGRASPSQVCYFDVYFTNCQATRGINGVITLYCSHKQFDTTMHRLFGCDLAATWCLVFWVYVLLMTYIYNNCLVPYCDFLIDQAVTIWNQAIVMLAHWKVISNSFVIDLSMELFIVNHIRISTEKVGCCNWSKYLVSLHIVVITQWGSFTSQVSSHNLAAIYRKISNIRHTKSPNLNVSHLVLQLSLPNPMKPGVKSRMKM